MRCGRCVTGLAWLRSRPGSDRVFSHAFLERPVQSLRQFATCALVALTVAACGWANAARADMVTYTLTGGEITGTLNGTAFTNASFTMTATADPSLFASTTVSGLILLTQPAVPTMTISGFAPFQITQANWGPFFVDASVFYYAGIGAYDGTLHGSNIAAAGALPSNLITGGSVSGSFGIEEATFSTSVGDLVITGQNDTGSRTFTSVASAVPEIDPAGMGSVLALVTGGLGLLERRRRQTA
jgi:hypothetical protein